MSIGERIKKRRKELNISADTLADAIGKDRSSVFRYEKGDIESLPAALLIPISKVLRTTPGYLLGTEEVEISQKFKKEVSLSHIINILESLDDEELERVKDVLQAMYKNKLGDL